MSLGLPQVVFVLGGPGAGKVRVCSLFSVSLFSTLYSLLSALFSLFSVLYSLLSDFCPIDD
jgi:hypothetical protein